MSVVTLRAFAELPDGEQLMMCGDAEVVGTWNPAAGKLLKQTGDNKYEVMHLFHLSSPASRVWLIHDEGTLCLMDYPLFCPRFRRCLLKVLATLRSTTSTV